MLRKEVDELQLLKKQVKELSEEMNAIKAVIKLDQHRFSDQQFGHNMGKIIGKMMFNNGNKSNYNKQLLNHFYKLFSHCINSPSSFYNSGQ